MSVRSGVSQLALKAARRLSAVDDRAFRRGCVLLASAGMVLWVGLFLAMPGLYPAGVFKENAPWQDKTPPAIRLVGDSSRYLLGSENLLAGRPLRNKQASYLGYVVLVAGCAGAGIGLPGVVGAQVLFALLSLPCLYGLARRLGGRWTAAVATLLYAANPEVAAWHTIIQTDSLYISCLLIVIWLYARAREGGWASGIAATLACVAVVFVRPNGWIVPPALGMHAVWTARSWARPAKILFTASMVALLLVGAIAVRPLRRGLDAEDPVRMLYQGEVLWGHAPWRLTMPEKPETATTLGHAFAYAARHPFACARLALARVGVLLVRVRPGYSFKHNLFVLLVYPPLLLLALLGAFATWRTTTGGAIVAVIAGHILTVALTFAHQDGRFFLYFFPEILILAAVSAVAWLGRWRRRGMEHVQPATAEGHTISSNRVVSGVAKE